MEELILLGLRCESKKSVKVKHACNILDNTYQNGKKIVGQNEMFFFRIFSQGICEKKPKWGALSKRE